MVSWEIVFWSDVLCSFFHTTSLFFYKMDRVCVAGMDFLLTKITKQLRNSFWIIARKAVAPKNEKCSHSLRNSLKTDSKNTRPWEKIKPFSCANCDFKWASETNIGSSGIAKKTEMKRSGVRTKTTPSNFSLFLENEQRVCVVGMDRGEVDFLVTKITKQLRNSFWKVETKATAPINEMCFHRVRNMESHSTN